MESRSAYDDTADLKSTVSVRSYFPETWLWDSVTLKYISICFTIIYCVISSNNVYVIAVLEVNLAIRLPYRTRSRHGSVGCFASQSRTASE